MKEINQPKQKVGTQYNAETIEFHQHHHHHKDTGQLSTQATPAKTECTSKKELVDVDQSTAARKERQTHYFKKLYASIDGNNEVVSKLIDEMNSFSEELSMIETKAVITKFYSLSDEQALDCLEYVFNRLRNERDKIVLGAFVEAWLLVVFEHPEEFESIRKKLEDSGSAPVDIPFCLSIPIEMLLANISGTKPSFILLPDGKVGASFDIGSLQEVGLDEDGLQTEKAILSVLSERLLSQGDLSVLEEAVEKALAKIFQETNKTNLILDRVSEEQRVKVLRSKLERLKNKHGRSYYICCDLDDGTSTDVFIRLKGRYPALLFINKKSPDMFAEYERYDRLCDIIAAGKATAA